ncbi:zinc finger protein [Forsythia ovata]|uniref:RING-type E3 ubiquitin transferase n=1 Tax=Forsythia ovata TaxID=205694 RepID=A0ABD1R4G1_9LAMI
MDHEHQQPLLGVNALGPTRFSHPLTTTTDHHRRHHRITIPDELENDVISDDDDDSPATFTRDSFYSKPFVILDIIWNLAFVWVSLFVLSTTTQEKPSTPLRLWIGGYALQCLLHVGFVWAQYQSPSLDGVGVGFYFNRIFSFSTICHNSIIKKLDSVNTVVSSIWWVVGFYWIIMGGQALLQDSPRLYWLLVVFLAFDLIFMIFCILMACIVFFALFFCFPILATVAYAMTIGEGASESDIIALPKYRYCTANTLTDFEEGRTEEVTLISKSDNSNSETELALHLEDSECCICLYKYVDGVELCRLPCNHHFHRKCISKWLRINATCPLCKFNILRGDTLV